MHEIHDTMENLLTSEKYKSLKDQFVKIKITDERPPVNPKIALSDRFQFIVELISESVVLQTKNYEEMKKMSPAEIIKAFLSDIRHFEADKWEEKQITTALDQIKAGVKLDGESEEECEHSDDHSVEQSSEESA